MLMQLRALPQPAAQHLRALLDGNVAGQQALADGPFGLPPQRLGDRGHQIGGLGDGHGVLLPGSGVPGVAEKEQQPGDLHLRPDADLDVADPGRADLPGRAHQPDPGTVRRRRRGDDLRRGQHPALGRRQRQLGARSQLVQLDRHQARPRHGDHGSGGAGSAAIALRRPTSP